MNACVNNDRISQLPVALFGICHVQNGNGISLPIFTHTVDTHEK